MSFLEFVEGPLWYAAAAVFLVGVAWRIVGLLMLGNPKDLSVPRGGSLGGALKAIVLHSVPHGGNMARTVYHVLVGYAFHIGLFVVLFFAAPHVDFIRDRILGWGWPAMPRWAFILSAEIAFAGLILLWVRRFTDPVMRQLSDWDDYVGTFLVFITMLTGCFALQESNDTLRAVHMLSVDLLLLYFPFSRLMHAFTFFLSRGYTGAFYGRRGFTP